MLLPSDITVSTVIYSATLCSNVCGDAGTNTPTAQPVLKKNMFTQHMILAPGNNDDGPGLWSYSTILVMLF